MLRKRWSAARLLLHFLPEKQDVTETLMCRYRNKYFMKKLIIICVALTGIISNTSAQKIFSTDADYKADVKVYVTDADYKADLLVYKVDADYKAVGNEGKWYFTDADYQAKKKIFFVNADYQADLIIFFVDADYKAKWNKSEKKHLMY